MNIIFEIAENSEVMILLKELKEIRLQIAAYSYPIKCFIKGKRMQKKSYILMLYIDNISLLRIRQKAIRKILKDYEIR